MDRADTVRRKGQSLTMLTRHLAPRVRWLRTQPGHRRGLRRRHQSSRSRRRILSSSPSSGRRRGGQRIAAFLDVGRDVAHCARDHGGRVLERIMRQSSPHPRSKLKYGSGSKTAICGSRRVSGNTVLANKGGNSSAKCWPLLMCLLSPRPSRRGCSG